LKIAIVDARSGFAAVRLAHVTYLIHRKTGPIGRLTLLRELRALEHAMASWCMMTTGRSGARHALAKSGSILSIAAMRLASFRASSVWFPWDMISTPQSVKDIISSPENTSSLFLGSDAGEIHRLAIGSVPVGDSGHDKTNPKEKSQETRSAKRTQGSQTATQRPPRTGTTKRAEDVDRTASRSTQS